jgi:hypothetical protein
MVFEYNVQEKNMQRNFAPSIGTKYLKESQYASQTIESSSRAYPLDDLDLDDPEITKTAANNFPKGTIIKVTPLLREDKYKKIPLYRYSPKEHLHSKQMYHKRMLHQLCPLHAATIHPEIPDNAMLQRLRVRSLCSQLQKETQTWET